ncbi:MAG: SDR family NAD(P)-dependent oxidoreductase, partial [Gemmobacter sp.]
MDLGLKGKKAIVTGATKGICRSLVDILAAEGCDIAFCARNAAEVEATAEALRAHGTKIVGGTANVKDGEAYQAWL